MPGTVRLASHRCRTIPPLDVLLGQLVGSLAEAAKLLWPDWYDGSLGSSAAATVTEACVSELLATRRILESRRSVNAAWLKGAAAACRLGREPQLPGFSLSTQAEQLALALTEHELVLAVCVDKPDHPPDRLPGLARALEWLARETGASVLALLPAELETRRELDPVTFGAVRWPPPDSVAPASEPALEESKHVLCPILGRPHPGSPGEQLLARRLARDAELGPLFGFNQRVATVFGDRYLVDLVWPAGRVVVEIDSHGFHTTRSVFNSDRQRDYELLLSGYLVLRLPHDLVVQDADLALARIRDVVDFRRGHPFGEMK
jgi:very-short-patch-repair endonuclease